MNLTQKVGSTHLEVCSVPCVLAGEVLHVHTHFKQEYTLLTDAFDRLKKLAAPLLMRELCPNTIHKQHYMPMFTVDRLN
jgi:hypothetical protein